MYSRDQFDELEREINETDPPSESVEEITQPYILGPEEIFLYEDEYETTLVGPYYTNPGASISVEKNAIGLEIDKYNPSYIRLPLGLKDGDYFVWLTSSSQTNDQTARLGLTIHVEQFPYYKYYIQIDERQRVINFASNGPHNQPGYFDSDEWKLLTDKGKNYQFTFEGEENPYGKFFNENGTPLWKWSYAQNLMVLRMPEEIQEDERPSPPPITEKDRLAALEAAMLEVIMRG